MSARCRRGGGDPHLRGGTGEGGRRPGSVRREQQGLITGCVLVFGLALFDGLKEHQLHFNENFYKVGFQNPCSSCSFPLCQQRVKMDERERTALSRLRTRKTVPYISRSPNDHSAAPPPPVHTCPVSPSTNHICLS